MSVKVTVCEGVTEGVVPMVGVTEGVTVEVMVTVGVGVRRGLLDLKVTTIP